MSRKILVSAAELDSLIRSGRAIAVDCRFDFADPDKGRSDWLAGHVPGAAYAHLDNDLCIVCHDRGPDAGIVADW